MISFLTSPSILSSVRRPIIMEVETDVTGKPELKIRCEVYGIKGDYQNGTPELLGTKNVRSLPDDAQRFRFNLSDLLASALSKDIAKTNLPKIITPNPNSIIYYYCVFTELYYDTNGKIQEFDTNTLPAQGGGFGIPLFACNTTIQHTETPQDLSERVATASKQAEFLTNAPRTKFIKENEDEELHFFVGTSVVGGVDEIELDINRTDANGDAVPFIAETHVNFTDFDDIIDLVNDGWFFSGGTLIPDGNEASPAWAMIQTNSFILTPDPDTQPQNAYYNVQKVEFSISTEGATAGSVLCFGRITGGNWQIISINSAPLNSWQTITDTTFAPVLNQFGFLFLVPNGSFVKIDDIKITAEARFKAIPKSLRAIASLPNLMQAPATRAEVFVKDNLGNKLTETFVYQKDFSCPRNKTRFLWLNPKGGIDRYTFDGFLDRRKEVKKAQYRKEIEYNIDPNLLGVTWDTEQRGLSTLQVTSEYIYTVYSQYEEGAAAQWLSEIYESPLVLWEIDGRRIAIQPTNDGATVTSESNLTQFRLSFTLASERILQNG